MTSELLGLLRCPDDRAELSIAEPELVDRANAAVRAGRLVDRGGRVIERQLDGGLVRTDGGLLYPIIDRIPILVRDGAIPLDQLDGSTTRKL